MKTSAICIACAISLAGCANNGPRNTQRVPANPVNFGGSVVRMDEEVAAATERDQLARTVAELRSELAELRSLFRVKSETLSTQGKIEPKLVDSEGPDIVGSATLPPAIGIPAQKTVSSLTPILSTPAPSTAARARAAPAVNRDATYTALFKFASSSLDDSARTALSALRPQLLAAKHVSLSAFADTSGDASLNERLAHARADSVKQELMRPGVPAQRIDVISRVADSAPPEGTSLLGLFRAPDNMSRRVDVALMYSPSTRPQ